MTKQATVVSQWYLYILRTKHNQLYTGVSTDVARRFAEHQSGSSKGAKALRGKGPLNLEFQQGLASKQQAMRLEYKIKQLSKAQKEQLLLGQFDWRSLL
ncbi:GIY-YIG nuclease family protein [Agarivorans sp. QJM3NY_29]|uniref:GIY-YIG nuclease family protein n=1 Tax=unclassified Agarivorans TaxID=2636026 RepID=UPI003D7D2265